MSHTCVASGCETELTGRRKLCDEHRGKSCDVDGCNRPALSSRAQYCDAHRARLVAFGDVRADMPIRETRGRIPFGGTCKYEGCDLPVKSRGYCSSHYDKVRKQRLKEQKAAGHGDADQQD